MIWAVGADSVQWMYSKGRTTGQYSRVNNALHFSIVSYQGDSWEMYLIDSWLLPTLALRNKPRVSRRCWWIQPKIIDFIGRKNYGRTSIANWLWMVLHSRATCFKEKGNSRWESISSYIFTISGFQCVAGRLSSSELMLGCFQIDIGGKITGERLFLYDRLLLSLLHIAFSEFEGKETL